MIVTGTKVGKKVQTALMLYDALLEGKVCRIWRKGKLYEISIEEIKQKPTKLYPDNYFRWYDEEEKIWRDENQFLEPLP